PFPVRLKRGKIFARAIDLLGTITAIAAPRREGCKVIRIDTITPSRNVRQLIRAKSRAALKTPAYAFGKAGDSMNFLERRPFADPEVAARKIIEIANSVEAAQDGRIHIEKINGPFLYQLKGTPAEYKAGLDRSISNGWLWQHESGTYVKFTEGGAMLFA